MSTPEEGFTIAGYEFLPNPHGHVPDLFYAGQEAFWDQYHLVPVAWDHLVEQGMVKPIYEKRTYTYRAINPHTTNGKPVGWHTYPTWTHASSRNLKIDSTEAMRAHVEREWPGYTLEVQETVVKEWRKA